MDHYIAVCNVAKTVTITVRNSSRQHTISYLIAKQQLDDICDWVKLLLCFVHKLMLVDYYYYYCYYAF